MADIIAYLNGRPIYAIAGAGGGPGGGEGGTDFGGPADPTGPGGPGDHEGQGGEGYGGGGSPADPAGPSGPDPGESEHGSGSQRDAGAGPGVGIDTDHDSDSDSDDENENDEIEVAPGLPNAPVDRDRASKAAGALNPDTHAIGGTPVALETGITNKGKFARGAGKTITGLLVGVPAAATANVPAAIAGGASAVSGIKDMKDSIGPVPGSASVSGGNTGIHDGKSSSGLLDSHEPGATVDAFSGRDVSGLGSEGEGGPAAPVLAPPPKTEPAPDSGGEGGEGGGLPSLPPPPSVPAVPPPPKFPNPNNVTGGGPGMRATRERIEDARKFGRQSTLLTGGEGLPDLGPVERPGLTAPTEALPAQPAAAGGDVPREGTRLGKGNGQGGRLRPPGGVDYEEIERLDQIEARNVQERAGDVGPGQDVDASNPREGLPNGWSLVRSYSTLPYDLVQDPNGARWFRDRETGDIVGSPMIAGRAGRSRERSII